VQSDYNTRRAHLYNFIRTLNFNRVPSLNDIRDPDTFKVGDIVQMSRSDGGSYGTIQKIYDIACEPNKILEIKFDCFDLAIPIPSYTINVFYIGKQEVPPKENYSVISIPELERKYYNATAESRSRN
jgi:hypothetical protein